MFHREQTNWEDGEHLVAFFADESRHRSFVERLRSDDLYDDAAIKEFVIPHERVQHRLLDAGLSAATAARLAGALEHADASEHMLFMLDGPAHAHHILAIAQGYANLGVRPPTSTCTHRPATCGKLHPTPLPYYGAPGRDYCPDCQHQSLSTYP